MNRTDKVRLTGQGTDLTFSVKDIPAVPCCGHMNIPDGEVYSAPVCDSVNEKIMGSIHFAPGNCYDDAFNGNHSAIHWDLVMIQTPEYGGGEIWFDDVLIRKDGRFVIPELFGLNPENLK